VIELRVHGILGTTAEALVDAVAAVDVAGDGKGRLVRPADRLRRPAPGPVLKADGRPLPRTLEGYVWGALTSGGWSKAVWALLFPFSLANVSSWMLPPAAPGNRVAAILVACCRGLLRLAAILLTTVLVAQLAAVSFDLVATQCLAVGSRCLSGVVPAWLRERDAIRPVIGVVPLLLVVLVLGRVSKVDWKVSDDRPDHQETDSARTEPVAANRRTRRLARLPGATTVADPDAPALRALHLTAALAAATLLALGGPGGWRHGGWALLSWSVAAVLLVACLVAALVFGDPTGARPSHPGHALLVLLSPTRRRLLTGLAVLTMASVPVVQPRLGTQLPGTDPTLGALIEALAGSCVLLAVLLVPAALLARSSWSGVPGELRPWAGGWMSAPFMALAALLGGGFGAGVGIAVRQSLGGAPLALPHSYAYVTLLWGVAGALAVLALALFGLVVGVRRLVLGVRVPDEVALLHEGRPQDAARAAPAWRLATWLRRHAHHVIIAITAVLAIGALVSAVPWFDGALPPTWTTPLSGVGLAALVFLALALLREVYMAARKPDTARQLGGLSDLCCFWPRESHPVVPPCYALKVVPEVAARAADYLKEPNTRVVLAGHSQGTVIVAAAATRLLSSLSEDDTRRLGIVVAGSPLQWAYARAFPTIVSQAGLLELYGDLDARWRTMSRGTDPIGGGLTTWRRQVFDGRLIGVGYRADGTSGALPAAVAGPTGALVLGGDHWLPDPERGPFPGRRWAAGVQRHGDYWSDPEWDRAIACAAGMESPTEVHDHQQTVFRLPGRGLATG
jgi:hypothetical protein